FQRIARALTDDMRRGRMRPGAPLPGTRTLVRSLGVHRNTVLAAYRELEAEGWVEALRGRATVVSTALPETRPRPFSRRAPSPVAAAERVGFDLGPPPAVAADAPAGVLSLSGGVPDLRLVPAEALGRALRRAVVRDRALLGYGDPRGDARLRRAL